MNGVALASSLVSLAVWVTAVEPAVGQTGTAAQDRAASALRGDPVYVDDGAERAIDGAAADRLRRRIRDLPGPLGRGDRSGAGRLRRPGDGLECGVG